MVGFKVVFQLGTRASPVVTELKLPINVIVYEGGQLDIPETTIVERGTWPADCIVHYKEQSCSVRLSQLYFASCAAYTRAHKMLAKLEIAMETLLFISSFADIISLVTEFISSITGLYLDTCGKISTVQNIVVRKEGILKGAYPSQTSDADNYQGTWDIESISIDHGGTITGVCVIRSVQHVIRSRVFALSL